MGLGVLVNGPDAEKNPTSIVNGSALVKLWKEGWFYVSEESLALNADGGSISEVPTSFSTLSKHSFVLRYVYIDCVVVFYNTNLNCPLQFLRSPLL